MCNLTRKAFKIEISDEEILKRIESDIITIPYFENTPIGFFSSDILSTTNKVIAESCFFSDFIIGEKQTYFIGIYESGSVLKPEFQGKGIYTHAKLSELVMCDESDFKFYTSRTQNHKVLNVFSKKDINVIPFCEPNYVSKIDRELGVDIARYLGCEKNFDSETFICKNVYEGKRSNEGLIKGLGPEDAYMLLAVNDESGMSFD